MNKGFQIFNSDSRVRAWSEAAAHAAREASQDAKLRLQWLRHQRTWFVGVDVLANAADGSICGVPLQGPWEALIEPPKDWHKAQISVVYEGYPKQDEADSDTNHRFRVNRCAAHVDGILLDAGRRFVREPHRFILGLPLGTSRASPLVVWPDSHIMMGRALRRAIGDRPLAGVDITDAYKAARTEVFKQIEPIEVHANIGQSIVLHRHLLHGVAPWKDTDTAPPEGRMVAYFRPQYAQEKDWLTAP